MTSKPHITTLAGPAPAARRAGLLRRLYDRGVALRRLHDRERHRLRTEVGRVPGLMALLMKPRNGQAWSRAERDTLRAQLRSMRRLGLYMAVMLIPGTAITLPLLAWWLDRRHVKRSTATAGSQGKPN